MKIAHRLSKIMHYEQETEADVHLYQNTIRIFHKNLAVFDLKFELYLFTVYVDL